IDIDGAAEPGVVAFWIDDEGPGPGDQETAGLFEQVRRSSAQEPEESGRGLGRYSVRSIVERHRGRVRPTPTAGGRTPVRAELPRSEHASDDEDPSEPSAERRVEKLR